MGKSTLKTIDLSNGEYGLVCELAAFLQWMKKEGIPIPERFDGEECDRLMVRYVKHVRHEQMQYISKERVARGETALPERLLRRGA